MSALLNEIKSKIQNTSCLVHNEKATDIRIVGSKITFNYCCDSFKKKLEGVMGKATKEYAEKELKKVFSKFK